MSDDLEHNEDGFFGTINLLLTVIILGVVAFAGYYLMNSISDAGGFSDWMSNMGSEAGTGVWGAISGAVGGFFGGAWKTGKSIGEATSPTKWNIFGWKPFG